tara:strand:- start:171 stop:365 length:195 start_codon:yes stop_codon:yes gene_type:complete
MSKKFDKIHNDLLKIFKNLTNKDYKYQHGTSQLNFKFPKTDKQLAIWVIYHQILMIEEQSAYVV